jgi:hypothetical protein
MIANGVCDQNCYNDACNNDLSDCDCAKGCNLHDSEFDFCSDECMDLRCDEYQQVQNCTDITKKKQNYYIQMLGENFDLRFSENSCFKSDKTCSEKDFVDYTKNPSLFYGQCQTEECAFLRPYYNDDSECREDCAICVDANICLECKPPKIQYFTTCVDECPVNYEATSISYLNQSVCIGNL